MKISFHGAARTVTGSKHLLTLKSGKKVLLDCGLFQGMGKNTEELNATFGFDPVEISYLILSHAHIDHSGLIPKFSKNFDSKHDSVSPVNHFSILSCFVLPRVPVDSHSITISFGSNP